jgi:hypothetical protein
MDEKMRAVEVISVQQKHGIGHIGPPIGRLDFVNAGDGGLPRRTRFRRLGKRVYAGKNGKNETSNSALESRHEIPLEIESMAVKKSATPEEPAQRCKVHKG